MAVVDGWPLREVPLYISCFSEIGNAGKRIHRVRLQKCAKRITIFILMVTYTGRRNQEGLRKTTFRPESNPGVGQLIRE